jgi:hypothetical protein
MRFGFWICFVSLMVTLGVAQGPKKPALIAACMDQKASYAPTETVNLTVTIENRGTSTFYVYRPLEWGWTGLWFDLVDVTGNPIRPKQPVNEPLPPLPLGDKSELVGLEPGYFYGRHLEFALSDYHLKPGTYFIAFMYHSYYHERDGLGLPILTWDDGEIVGNKIAISVR